MDVFIGKASRKNWNKSAEKTGIVIIIYEK